MSTETPLDVITKLTESINRGDLERALGLYEHSAVLVSRPGTTACGTAELRVALGGFIAMRPTLTSQAYSLVESGDIALYLGRWKLLGTDPTGQPITLSGESTDVLRRQPDGRWLIAVDNPWGIQLIEDRVGAE
jgi:ketosteroid isomerase-like protein